MYPNLTLVSIALIEDYQIEINRILILKGNFMMFPLTLKFEDDITYANWVEGLNILLKRDSFGPETAKIIRRLTDVEMNLNAISALIAK